MLAKKSIKSFSLVGLVGTSLSLGVGKEVLDLAIESFFGWLEGLFSNDFVETGGVFLCFLCFGPFFFRKLILLPVSFKIWIVDIIF